MREPLSNIGLVHPHCLPPPPTSEELDSVRVGFYVKLIRQHERFWVKVDSLDPLNGTINNDLLLTDDHGLRNGDLIAFDRGEIIQILTADEIIQILTQVNNQ